MIKSAIIAQLDELLNPLGFTRQKSAWNRKGGHFVEAIDFQVSKEGDTLTLNAGVLDIEVHAKLWGSEPPSFIEAPDCTVSARIGELIDGKDLWWQFSDNQVGDKVATAVVNHVLPFLKRIHSRQGMVQRLTDTGVAKKRYPPPIINLAILFEFLGETVKTRALLTDLQSKEIGAWRARVLDVSERLGFVD